MSDINLAIDRLRGVIGQDADPSQIACFVQEGAFGTRVGRVEYQADLIRRFQRSVPWRPWSGNIAIVAVFFRPNRQRIDCDNLMKPIMDAATKAGVWGDDCQVTAQAALIELDVNRPRTVIAISPADSSMDRDLEVARTCTRCGSAFSRRRWYPTQPPKFCSAKCARASERATARCPRCDREFTRRGAGQRYCSKPCANAAPRVRKPNSEQRPPATCRECGARVSRREYVRCAKCSPKGRRQGSKNVPKQEVRL